MDNEKDGMGKEVCYERMRKGRKKDNQKGRERMRRKGPYPYKAPGTGRGEGWEEMERRAGEELEGKERIGNKLKGKEI